MFIMTMAAASRQATMPPMPSIRRPPPLCFTAFFLPKAGMDWMVSSLTWWIKAASRPAGKAEILTTLPVTRVLSRYFRLRTYPPCFQPRRPGRAVLHKLGLSATIPRAFLQ